MSSLFTPPSAPALLASVSVAIVRGDGECWWHATSKALGEDAAALQQEMATVLRGIIDPDVLYALAIINDPTLGAAEVAAAKQSFLDGSFKDRTWAGAREMQLLSYCRRNTSRVVRFVTFASPVTGLVCGALACWVRESGVSGMKK